MKSRRDIPDEVRAEVKAANRERRPVRLTSDDLAKLGHRKRPLAQVIRRFCLSCQVGNAAEVRRCTSPACELFPYRFGKNVFDARAKGDS